MRFLSIYLGLCKRAVAVAILFSSLVCNAVASEPAASASQSRPAVIAPASSVFADALIRERAARAANPGPYTITGDANRTVTPGTYTQIIVDSPNTAQRQADIIIGAGEVTLTGAAEPLFSTSTAGKNNKLQLETKSGPAILRLEQGNATGIVGVGLLRSTSANGDNMLYIGSGKSESGASLPTVTLTGSINGLGRSAIERYNKESLIETQGANLVVKGNISDNESSAMLRTLNAYNGNIETDSGGVAVTSPQKFDIYAYNVNLKSGNHISAAVDFFASSVNIPANAYIYAGNRLDVAETIGEKGGSLDLGSTLESGKMVVLRGGLTKGAGLIKSGTRSILSHIPTGDKDVETALFPIRQGGDDPLVLEAGQDILPGDTDVDTMRAGGDIVAGTLTFIQGSTENPFGALPGRYFLNAGGEGFTYPRTAITANTIDVKGRLLAGELNMPRKTGGKEASLKAGNIWITNSASAENGFEKASGNFTLDNGSFILSNPDNLKVKKGLENTYTQDVTLDYASIVDGNMTVTRNKDSSFTTLNVGETASISDGTLKGALLKANEATFTNVTETDLSDTLDIATNLTITGNGNATVTHTRVGQAASITGGTYAGTDFKADSADFSNVDSLSLTGDFSKDANLNITKDLNIAGNGNATVDHAIVGGTAKVSGGTYSGMTFAANNADFSSMESVNMDGDFGTTADASFENVKSATLADMEVGNKLSVTSSYLKAAAASATSATFANNTSAEFDDLTLTGDDLSLVIESDSTVFINNSLSDLKGIEAIQGGKLIIHGYNDTPSTIAEIYIDKDTALANEKGIFNLTKGLYGGDKDGTPASADFTQLTAGEIEITNADLTLAGIGNFANKVDHNLIIHQNGTSRLGDISVGGNVEIDGGSLAAGQMDAAGNASFDAVGLNLSGPGSIGGNLVITNNSDSSIGEIAVAGKTEVSGGVLAADKLETGSATLVGAIQANIGSLVVTASSGSLDIGDSGEAASTVNANNVDLNGAPLTVHGESALQIHSGANGGNLDAGAINIPESGTVSVFGDIAADSVALGHAGADLAGGNVTIQQPLTEMKGGAITATDGNVTLVGGAQDAKGEITANADIIAGSDGKLADLGGKELALDAGGNISAGKVDVDTLAAGGNVEAQDIAANKLTAGGDVTASEGSLNLTGEGSEIGGNLTLKANRDSSLGDLAIGGDLAASGGKLAAGNLSAASTTLDGAIAANISELVLNGSDSFLNIGKEGEAASSLTANSLNLNGGPLNVYGSSSLEVATGEAPDSGALTAAEINIFQNGKVNANGAIAAQTVRLGQDGAELAGASVSVTNPLVEMKGGAIKATAGDVALAGGAQGASGSISASNDIISGSAGNYHDISGAGLTLAAGGNINAAALDADSLSAGANIAAKDITAQTLLADGNVIASQGSLNLEGTGKIGGNLDLPANRVSNIGSLEVGGSVDVEGGKFSAGQISTGSEGAPGNFTITNGSFSFGENSADASVIHGTLTATGNGSSSFGDLTVDKDFNISEGYVEGQSLHANSAAFTNYSVAYFDNLTLAELGSLKIEEGSMVTVGSIDAPGVDDLNMAGLILLDSGPSEFGFFEISDSVLHAEKATVNAYAIKGSGQSSEDTILTHQLIVQSPESGESEPGYESGSVVLDKASIRLTGKGEYSSRIENNLIITHNDSSNLGEIEVGGQTAISGGRLQALKLSTGSANLENIRATFDELVLSDSAGSHEFALTSAGPDASEATVGSLNLNGGLLNLAANSAAPANLFVGQFAGQANVINGNIAVSKNGLLVMGAQNGALLQTPNAIAASGLGTFALAQPMRLDSRFGIHVTGAPVANPASNSIRFDAGSLFVIDSRMAKAVYAYLGSQESIVPSAQLSETNGAIGALSADKASVPANVNAGAQIYIRNPVANTVIVALGENITTLYADKTGRAGDGSAAPWTGANLDYDNKDKVKIERLANQYAGQFLVLPVDGPDDPKPPVDPEPDAPNPPVDPDPVKPNPPSPSQPDTPDNPDPDNPDNPDPDKPDTPDEPSVPDEPEPVEPDKPERPVEPESPASPPMQPGQQFIHDTHTVYQHNPGKAEQVINSASHLATAGGVPHLVHAANETAGEVILRRARILDILAEGGELSGKSYALWALPLYKGISGHDLGAGSGQYGYNGGIGGVILGADITFAQKFRAGLDFNIGGGYTKSSGNLSQTENNMSFWGLGAYAGYREGNLGLEAEFSFTSSYNKVKQDTPEDLHWGQLKSDILATAISAALQAEYRFETGFLDIVPHAGVRYLNLHALSYDINASGRGTIVEGSGFYQNIWTFPFGVYLGRTFELENGVKIMPSLDFTVIPATGDLDTKNKVWYTGEVQEFDLHARFMDDITYGGSAGIEVKAGDFTIGVNYSGQFGSHTASNGVFGLLRYEF